MVNLPIKSSIVFEVYNLFFGQTQFDPDIFFFDFLFGDLEGEAANLLYLFGETEPK